MRPTYRDWKKWEKRCVNPWWYKLLVLFGVISSPTLYHQMLYRESEEYMRKFIEEGK